MAKEKMRQLTIKLTEEEMKCLEVWAEKELRTSEAQARYLLRLHLTDEDTIEEVQHGQEMQSVREVDGAEDGGEHARQVQGQVEGQVEVK